MSKRPDFVGNEIYRKHLARGEGAFMPNTSRDVQSVYERFYYKRLTELATSRFHWHNLPTSVDPRYLEMTLLRHALVVFFRDEDLATYNTTGVETGAFLALAGNGSGSWNMTNNPTRFTVTGNNYPTKILPAKECVPIWANYSRTPDLDVIQIYAHRLANLDRTIDINAKNSRRSTVVFADENQRLTAANIVRRIDEGDPVIYVNNPIEGTLTSVDLGVDPKGIEALHILKVRLWNECMMLLGIQSANQDKKERLIDGEVDANMEQIDLNRETALNARQLACDQINRKYGEYLEAPVSVEFVTQEKLMTPTVGE